jgi:hypothetical protein
LEAAATVMKNKLTLPHRYRHRDSGSAAMDISGMSTIFISDPHILLLF